jgi:hypothetical protein
MIWRRSNPLASRLMRIAEVVRQSAESRVGTEALHRS